jgi:hypothetical protein
MTLLKICKEVVSSQRTSFEIHIGERLICARAKRIPFEVWRAYAGSVHPLSASRRRFDLWSRTKRLRRQRGIKWRGRLRVNRIGYHQQAARRTEIARHPALAADGAGCDSVGHPKLHPGVSCDGAGVETRYGAINCGGTPTR